MIKDNDNVMMVSLAGNIFFKCITEILGIRWSEKVSSSCSTIGIRRATLVTEPFDKVYMRKGRSCGYNEIDCQNIEGGGLN